MVPQAGVDPSGRMWAAHCTSVSNVPGATWQDFWNTLSVFEFVDRDGIVPSKGIKIRIDLGMEDVNVDYQQGRALVELLAKFPDADVQCHVEPDKGHAEDYDEPLSKYIDFLNYY
jgi:hypothetical protein